MVGLTLVRAPGRYAIARLGPGDDVPEWFASARGFASATRTPAELSLMCAEASVPASVAPVERGWVGWSVRGQLDFGMVGVMAELSTALAEAGVSLLATSTYDTDWLFVREPDRTRAEQALVQAGFEVEAG